MLKNDILFIIFVSIVFLAWITILTTPTTSERLAPTKLEMCKLDPRCSYKPSDIPNKEAEEFTTSSSKFVIKY